MYNLPYFTEKDNEKVLAFMKANYFAVVNGNSKQYPVATHLPLEILERNNKLFFAGHLMRNTDHHKAFLNDPHVLVIFNGPHTYVSASCYSTPAIASTWNYMTVHAKGRICFGDENDTYNAVRRITELHEERDSAATFDNLSPEYISGLIKAIVSFEIEVESYESVFKLSQNHNEENRRRIIKYLSEKTDPDAQQIANEMISRLADKL